MKITFDFIKAIGRFRIGLLEGLIEYEFDITPLWVMQYHSRAKVVPYDKLRGTL